MRLARPSHCESSIDFVSISSATASFVLVCESHRTEPHELYLMKLGPIDHSEQYIGSEVPTRIIMI